MKQTKSKMINGNELLSKSVLPLCAQNPTQCAIGNSSRSVVDTFISKVITDSSLSAVDKGLMLLMLKHGLRVSEALSLNATSFKGNGRIFLKGLKGSNNRIIEGVDYYLEMLQFCQRQGSLSNCCSRYYLYRTMKRKGIFIAHENSDKLSVTHAGRHLQVQELEKSGIELSDIQNFIGHKSIKSTQCYAGRKSKK